MPVVVLHGSLDEGFENRLGILGGTLVFGMELHSYKERVRGYLDYLGQSGLRVAAGDAHAGGVETLHVVVVELER